MLKKISLLLISLYLFTGCTQNSSVEKKIELEGYKRYDSNMITFLKDLNNDWQYNIMTDAFKKDEERYDSNVFIINRWGEKDKGAEYYYFEKDIYVFSPRTGEGTIPECAIDLKTNEEYKDPEFLEENSLSSECDTINFEMSQNIINIFNDELEKLQISQKDLTNFLVSLEYVEETK